jgi:hypothetical protein
MMFRKEYLFLSNFYPVIITSKEGHRFPCVENAYQWMRAGQPMEYLPKYLAFEPAAIKKFTKRLPISPTWREKRIKVMERLIARKFAPNTALASRLMAIEEEIIETNLWHDNFWGDCVCSRCHATPGQNNLGKILMAQREALKKA